MLQQIHTMQKKKKDVFQKISVKNNYFFSNRPFGCWGSKDGKLFAESVPLKEGRRDVCSFVCFNI